MPSFYQNSGRARNIYGDRESAKKMMKESPTVAFVSDSSGLVYFKDVVMNFPRQIGGLFCDTNEYWHKGVNIDYRGPTGTFEPYVFGSFGDYTHIASQKPTSPSGTLFTGSENGLAKVLDWKYKTVITDGDHNWILPHGTWFANNMIDQVQFGAWNQSTGAIDVRNNWKYGVPFGNQAGDKVTLLYGVGPNGHPSVDIVAGGMALAYDLTSSTYYGTTGNAGNSGLTFNGGTNSRANNITMYQASGVSVGACTLTIAKSAVDYIQPACVRIFGNAATQLNRYHSIAGAMFYRENGGPRFINMAASGAVVQDYDGTGTGPVIGQASHGIYQNWVDHLGITDIWLGIGSNNIWSGESSSTIIGRLNGLIAFWRTLNPNMRFIVMDHYDSTGLGGGHAAAVADWSTAVKDTYSSRPGVMVMSIYDEFGSYAYQDYRFRVDGVHPTPGGVTDGVHPTLNNIAYSSANDQRGSVAYGVGIAGMIARAGI